MPRILLIASHFPPLAASASLRARGFCRYLPAAGWNVTVLTPAGIFRGPRDYELLDGLPDGVDIEPVRCNALERRLAGAAARGGEAFEQLPGREGGSGPRGEPAAGALSAGAAGARGWLRRANLLLVPDVQAALLPRLVRAGVRAGRRDGVGAVVATSPPESSLLAGVLVAQRLGVPFFADLRDAWTLGPYAATGKSRARRAIEARQERWVIERAERVFCVSETMRERYAKLYPPRRDRFVVVENGHDDADFDEAAPIRSARWNLLHAGSLKSGERLRAAIRMADAFAELPAGDAVLEFAGEIPEALRERAARADVSDRVSLLGALTHRETVARLSGAGALLLLVDAGAEVVTGKLAEYLRAGRPIFAIAPREGEAARRLTGRAEAEIVPPETPASFAGPLAAFIERCRAPQPAPERGPALGPSREAAARLMARYLDLGTGASERPAARRRPAAPAPDAVGAAPGRRAGPDAGPDAGRSAASSAAVSFVVVTRDRPRDLERALASIVRQEGGPHEIVVVDDGSEDAASIAAAVSRAAPAARLVRADRNEGVAASRNRGAREAHGAILVFLDDDAVFTDGRAACRIEAELAAHPQAAIAALRVVRADGAILRREFPSRHLWRAEWPGRAPYFCGCGFALRRDAHESLRGFDPAFFYALEELDLSLRAAAAGFAIRYLPNVEVLHTPSQAARPEGAWLRHSMRSRCLLAWKDLPAWAAASHVALWGGYLLARGVRERAAGVVLAGFREGVRAARGSRRAPVPAHVLRTLAPIGGRTFF